MKNRRGYFDKFDNLETPQQNLAPGSNANLLG